MIDRSQGTIIVLPRMLFLRRLLTEFDRCLPRCPATIIREISDSPGDTYVGAAITVAEALRCRRVVSRSGPFIFELQLDSECSCVSRDQFTQCQMSFVFQNRRDQLL